MKYFRDLFYTANTLLAVAFTKTRSNSHIKASSYSEDEDSKESKIEALIRTLTDQHEEEINVGFQIYNNNFDHSSNPNYDNSVPFKSIGFKEYVAPKGSAGPDEFELGDNGNVIYQSLDPMFTHEECDNLVEEAKSIIESDLKLNDESFESDENSENGSRKRYASLRNSDIGEVRVSSMVNGRRWLTQAMSEKLLPLLESKYGISSEDLTLHDALIIGYGYFGNGEVPTRSQPLHRDTSLVSLNIALSNPDEYVGGGTFFEALSYESSLTGVSLQNPKGHVLCHSSGLVHAGYGLQSGQRWVLVLFLLAKDVPQIARRCHAQGSRAESENILQNACLSYEAGLAISKYDHCLLRDMGRMELAQKNYEEGISLLRKSAFGYKYCVKPLIMIGQTYMDRQRMRAALRYFEQALELMSDKDLLHNAFVEVKADGYNARFFAASCALVCADKDERFPRERIVAALNRVDECIKVVPNNPYLESMREKAMSLILSAQ